MSRRSIQIFLALIAGLMIFLGDALVLLAQETKSEEFTLEEITVTAQKRETNVQKTPIAIQTVSGDELAQEAKTRLDDIMQGVVGVASQGSQVGTDFYMRGIGTGNFGPPTGGLDQPAVAVMIDGVYQNRGEVVRGGSLDMQRVEIMRGTQSTTLGGSSLAGAVSLVSNNPVFKYEASGSLELGNYHLVDVQGVLNVPLSESQALRFAYSTDKRDGYISSGAGDSDLANARIKYRLQATEAVEIIASFNHQTIGGNGVNTGMLTYDGYWEGYNVANKANYNVTMGYPIILGHVAGVKYDKRDNPWDDGYPADLFPNNPFRHTNIDQYSAEIHWDLGIGALTMTPSYQQAHFTSAEPPRGGNWRSEDRTQKTKQLDVQLASPNESAVKWLGGVYYYDTRFTGTIITTEYALPPGAGRGSTDYTGDMLFSWSSTNPNIQTTYAAYGNLTYPVLDVFRINAGLRYTHDKKSTVSSTSASPGGAPGTATGPDSPFVYGDPNEATWKAATYRVGAEYDVTEQAMAYALYATGYQPGTFAGGGTTGSQKLEQWTAGLKSRWFDKKLQVNLEGFQSTYHNRPLDGGLSYSNATWKATTTDGQCGEQGPPGTPGIPYEYDPITGAACYSSGQGVTVPNMSSEGADLSINWVITETDRFDASAEYLHSVQKIPQLPVAESYFVDTVHMTPTEAAAFYASLGDVAKSYDGLVLQNSPKWSANASYSHIFTFASGSTLTPKINMEYKGSYWSMGGGPNANIADTASCTQASYTLWNAYLNWNSSDGQFSINAYIKNIQNKPVLTNVGVESGYRTVSLASPRTFGMVFNVRL
jgi:iron complex outermembrane recepter protein